MRHPTYLTFMNGPKWHATLLTWTNLICHAKLPECTSPTCRPTCTSPTCCPTCTSLTNRPACTSPTCRPTCTSLRKSLSWPARGPGWCRQCLRVWAGGPRPSLLPPTTGQASTTKLTFSENKSKRLWEYWLQETVEFSLRSFDFWRIWIEISISKGMGIV